MPSSAGLDNVQKSASSYTALIVAVVVSALLIVILIRVLWASKGSAVLLLGASGAGKTTLFYQLRDGTTHQGTVPSLQQNEELVQLKLEKVRMHIRIKTKENVGKGARAVEVVDIPGHAKVRGKAADYYGRAGRIVFLVDSVEFMGQKTDVAEHLFEVLADSTVQTRRTPVLLVCNKADLGAKAHTPEFVRKRLEREIETLRGTRDTLGGGTSSGGPALARRGEPFTFAGLRTPRVSVASASALVGDIGEILAFLK